MDLLIAYWLSKLLITAILCYRSQTFAQGSCGYIGDNSETQHSAYDGDGFYLNIGNRAYCSGNIISWRVCYYRPEELGDGDLYEIKYAVYRRSGADYIRVPNSTFNFTLSGREESDKNSGSHQKCNESGDSQTEAFCCFNMPLSTPFAVHAGDIIGACVVGSPELREESNHSNVHRLNIVSEVNNRPRMQIYVPMGHPLHNEYITSCQMNATLPPAIIDFDTQFSPVRSRRLHISANISKYIANYLRTYTCYLAFNLMEERIMYYYLY